MNEELERRGEQWSVEIAGVLDTDTSLLAFGDRAGQPVVIKLARHPSEWSAGVVTQAFNGAGVVRVFEHDNGATLLEWLRPAAPLSELALDDHDERATAVLGEVIAAMKPGPAPSQVPSADGWAESFDRYLGREGGIVPRTLALDARRLYFELCGSQRQTRLLHGDLHHDNVLFDYRLGWVAIDPKGVVGELEFEVGAALRNPVAGPWLFADPKTIERRVARFAQDLNLDRGRILAWAFAQAVLAVIWLVEDGAAGEPAESWLTFAETVRTRYLPGR